MQDVLINADYWRATPEILAANYAFENIIGVPDNQADVIAAGGAWQNVTTPDPPARAVTSSSTPQGTAVAFGYPVNYADALPVVFSWPVLPSTVQASDFLYTLNTGEKISPEVVSINPNMEYNERSTVVTFGEYGNRLTPGTEGAIYVTNVEIVADDTALQLVGPDGLVSAVGLSFASGNPYVPNGGPSLVGAKLSIMSTAGEGAPPVFTGQLPNDGIAYYGDAAEYRLRLLTTGGVSPDGVSSVYPDDFENHFRVRVQDGADEIWLTETGQEYPTSVGNIIIHGLADLGATDDPLNDAYVEDHDNQIDIIMSGDEAAMRLITHVEIPAAGDYLPFYNPGGPGNDPTVGVTYTMPGPYDLEPVIMALDDPMTVTYIVPEPSVTLLFGTALLLGILNRRRIRG